MIVSPTDAAIYARVGAWLGTVVPAGTQVVRGLPDRAAMPRGPYVCMQIILDRDMSTPTSAYEDPYPDPAQGTRVRQQSVALSMQLDFYGPTARDNARMVKTMFRDDHGCDGLRPECQPMFCDDAKMIPLVTGESQYLERWTLTAALNYHPVTSTPQEFAGELSTTIINVDVSYPP